jgi:DNA repair exonuclease SbcCD ATPase subunit
MIHFHKVRWRNFLSTGNAFTEIELDKRPTTLIVGENGSGKSTLLDAICFALFGKPYRNINKPQLVNTINNKNCQVEIHFSIGSRQYKIVRGIKPSIFEIWIDGNLINQDAASRDYQKYLEVELQVLYTKCDFRFCIIHTIHATSCRGSA